MGKRSNRIPSALKHGIYSGFGLLPTESRAKFRKFKKQRFAELNLVGRLEEDVGEEIFCWEWRRQNFFTYDLAERARERHRSIYAQFDPPWSPCLPPLLPLFQSDDPVPEAPTPKQQAARRKRADKQARTELGAAFELVQIGEVATLGHLEKRLAILERLDGMITRAYKKLLYVRGIKSMSISAPPAPSEPTLVPQQIDCST